MRQVVLDTETTGLDAVNGDRIIEVGCVELDNRRPTGRTLHHYVNPGRSSHPDALKVHGITDEFLADKPTFAEIADEVLAFVADAEVIAHNASFDAGFLDAELKLLGRPPFAEHCAAIIDSLAVSKQLNPGKRHNLDALCERYGVSNTHRTLHGALLDAQLLAEVYLAMTRGQDSLVIEAEHHGAQGASRVDLSAFAVRVLVASEAEVAAHEAVLSSIEKETKRPSLWRELASAPNAL